MRPGCTRRGIYSYDFLRDNLKVELSNWINLLAVVVSLIAAGIAWDAKTKADKATRRSNELSKQANEIQELLIGIEKQRDELFDQLERTPNLSVTKVCLQTRDHVFFLRLTLTNLGKHTIQIIRVGAGSHEEGPLAESSCNIVIQASETFENEVRIEPVLYDHVETPFGKQRTERRRYKVEWIVFEVHSVEIEYLYAPTSNKRHGMIFWSDRTPPNRAQIPPPTPGKDFEVDFDPSKAMRTPYS